MTKTIILAGLVLGATILCSITVTDAFAAVDVFLKIDGVEGESQKPGHEGDIDVLAWSWGFSQRGSAAGGGGGGSGKVNVADLSFTKFVDSATVPLLKSCCRGEHIPEVEVHFFDSTRGDAEPYLKYKLTRVIVTSYQTGGSGGEDRLTENVSLNFAKIEVEYKKQGDPATPSDSVIIKKRPARG